MNLFSSRGSGFLNTKYGWSERTQTLKFAQSFSKRMENQLLSTAQIEHLQSLIRQFKILGKRFSESNIPKLIEAHALSQQSGNHLDAVSVSKQLAEEPAVSNNSTSSPSTLVITQTVPLTQNFSSQPMVSTQSKPIAQPNRPITTPPQNSQLPKANQQFVTQPPKPSNSLVGAQSADGITAATQPLSLSWQCFHSLLLFGTGRPAVDGNISFPPTVCLILFFFNCFIVLFWYYFRMLVAFPKALICH